MMIVLKTLLCCFVVVVVLGLAVFAKEVKNAPLLVEDEEKLLKELEKETE